MEHHGGILKCFGFTVVRAGQFCHLDYAKRFEGQRHIDGSAVSPYVFRRDYAGIDEPVWFDNEDEAMTFIVEHWPSKVAEIMPCELVEVFGALAIDQHNKTARQEQAAG